MFKLDPPSFVWAFDMLTHLMRKKLQKTFVRPKIKLEQLNLYIVTKRGNGGVDLADDEDDNGAANENTGLFTLKSPLLNIDIF